MKLLLHCVKEEENLRFKKKKKKIRGIGELLAKTSKLYKLGGRLIASDLLPMFKYN